VQTYLRRDAWRLHEEQEWHPILQWYARAVQLLQARDGPTFADPTSWRHLAAIHAIRMRPSERPPGTRWDQCEHGSWFFLPWHRGYLYHFEKIVRAAVVSAGGPDDWALPYWDYSDPSRPDTRRLPPAFRAATLPSGEPNPLRVPQRGPGVNDGGSLTTDAVATEAALGERDFTTTAGGAASGGFGGGVGARAHFGETPGALENTPHGDVHMGVGGVREPRGWMSGFDTAGRDPIFWLHHANLDRLWEVWRRRGGRNPTLKQWLDERLVFGGGTVVTDLAVRDVLDTLQPPMAYAYEGVALEPTAVPELLPEGPMREGAPKIAGTTEVPVPLTNEATTAEIPVTAAPDAGLEGVAEAAGGRVFLRLEGVRGSHFAAGSFAVYVALPKGARASDFADRRVGQLSMFGVLESSQSDESHAGAGLSFSFDITELVRRLEAAGEWRREKVEVTFVPLPDSEGRVYAGADVTVRRITVYYV
jgi:tyrosinase